MQISDKYSFHGELSVPGDKSISHRSIMFGAISEGLTVVSNFLQGADCLSTISCFQKMGINIENNGCTVRIHGNGLHGLSAPTTVLDVGNSGTTTRLISGILAGQSFESVLDGDDSIRKRPMKRIFTPLTQMGAEFESWNPASFPHSMQKTDLSCAPFSVRGGHLHGICYQSPVASAQVKSAVLLAGLYAEGVTSVTEPVLSRNHTELMLSGFGAAVHTEGTTASIEPEPKLQGQNIHVPGDISSAAYFIALGLLTPHSEILIKNVGINPTRSGILKAAQAMGGNLSLLNERTVSGEPVADILVTSSSLHGTMIDGEIIPTLIDEIPILAVMAAFAEGSTVIRDAQELKIKESDRIAAITENLNAMGALVTPADDGMSIEGGRPLHGAQIKTQKDHRIAMAFTVAGLNASGETLLDDEDCVAISYPTFYEDISALAD